MASECAPRQASELPISSPESSPQVEPLWSVIDGVFDPNLRPPSRDLVKDVINYTYDRLEQPTKRISIDSDLAIYAVRLCQPEIFDKPENRHIKNALQQEIRQAAETCQALDHPIELLPRLARLAAQQRILNLPPIAAINYFDTADEHVKSRVSAVIYYVALEQAGLKDFLPTPE
jgi:hypothetical protein